MSVQLPAFVQPVTDDGSIWTRPWYQWADQVTRQVNRNWGSGTTAQRPTGTALQTGDVYFDTTVARPIWWNGSIWIFSDGTPA